MMSTKSARGVKSTQVSAYHDRLLLQHLRRAGPASRADLARDTQLTHTAASNRVLSLEQSGLIRPVGAPHGWPARTAGHPV